MSDTVTDDNGVWHVDGNVRVLVEPSDAYLAARVDPVVEFPPDPSERIAQLEAAIAALTDTP